MFRPQPSGYGERSVFTREGADRIQEQIDESQRKIAAEKAKGDKANKRRIERLTEDVAVLRGNLSAYKDGMRSSKFG